MVDAVLSQVLPPKNLRDRLAAWDSKTDPRAPLTERQRDAFIELTTQSSNRRLPTEVHYTTV